MDPTPGTGMFFVWGIFALLTVIVVAFIWQFASTQRAKASAAREEAYRKLAEDAIKTQSEIAEALKEIRPKIAEIEKLLREVE